MKTIERLKKDLIKKGKKKYFITIAWPHVSRTPEAVHYGLAKDIQIARGEVLRAAYEAHPERFVKRIPVPPLVPEAAWINNPKIVTVSEEKIH